MTDSVCLEFPVLDAHKEFVLGHLSGKTSCAFGAPPSMKIAKLGASLLFSTRAPAIFIADLMRLRRTTRYENEVQTASGEKGRKGQSVVQASLVGDCLEVGIRSGDTNPA
jgi:hypothetical protein